MYDDVSIAKAAALVFAEKLDLRHDLVPEKGHNNALTIVHSFTCESTTVFFSESCNKCNNLQLIWSEQIHTQIMFNWLLVCIENKVCIFVSWWLPGGCCWWRCSLYLLAMFTTYCILHCVLCHSGWFHLWCCVLFFCCLTSCLPSWCMFLSHFYLLWCIVSVYACFCFPLIIFPLCWYSWIVRDSFGLNFCSCVLLVLLAHTSRFPLACLADPKKKPDLEVHSVDALGFQPRIQQLLRPDSQLSCTTASRSTVLRQLKNAMV